MKIETQARLLKLRGILNVISDTSFAFRQLFNKFQIQTMNEEDGEKLIKAYEDLILQVKNSLTILENER